ncbi:oleate hydratase, partial [Staphylococcus hominis]|uniref:oleate hydratase n=1 Tax=Staphylococcus hominis TaxID=1290 RepID=UPI001643B030
QYLPQNSPYLLPSPLPSLPPPSFLITHPQIDRSNIHILQQLSKSPPTFHPTQLPIKPYLIPPPTQIQNHFHSLSHFFPSIPSLQIQHPSLLHQFYSLNKQHPNYSTS